MAKYDGRARQDRFKAAAAVLLVHSGLALLIASGFHIEPIRRAAEQLTIVTLHDEPPLPATRPPSPPPPTDLAAAPAEKAAPAQLRSQAAPIAAPPPEIRLPLTPPLTASPMPAQGSDRTAGAAPVPGPGSGAGGQGSGTGGGGLGGAGSGASHSPPRLIRNLRDRDYRQIGGDWLPAGMAAMALRIGSDGAVIACRVVGSSGDAVVDERLCAVVARRLRFRPALDQAGRPAVADITYIASWRPR